jgi:hypothetical protein
MFSVAGDKSAKLFEPYGQLRNILIQNTKLDYKFATDCTRVSDIELRDLSDFFIMNIGQYVNGSGRGPI